MNNYDYPEGSDLPNAPWNEIDFPPIEKDVLISTTLSRSATVSVDDYDLDDWEEEDFSNCDFQGAYKDQYYTITQLLHILEGYVNDKLKADDLSKSQHSMLRKILCSCSGWEVDEEEVIKE